MLRRPTTRRWPKPSTRCSPAAYRDWMALAAAAVGSAQDYVDTVAERARREFDVPGIAVAIVKDGNVVLSKGYGVRKLGDPAPVTPLTLFRIASNTKAFTAAALASLV